MCFSDTRFPYGPFPPHHVPRQYVESYFSHHKADELLSLNTTVEDITKLRPSSDLELERWRLTLRKYDPARHVDVWWEEVFDAVILANGHYSVPYVCSQFRLHLNSALHSYPYSPLFFMFQSVNIPLVPPYSPNTHRFPTSKD